MSCFYRSDLGIVPIRLPSWPSSRNDSPNREDKQENHIKYSIDEEEFDTTALKYGDLETVLHKNTMCEFDSEVLTSDNLFLIVVCSEKWTSSILETFK